MRFILEGDKVKGIQLWIRNAKVPDPAGVLVVILIIDQMKEICPVLAVKKHLMMRDSNTTNTNVY